MVAINDYAPAMPYQWCPGCGNFGIVGSLRQALVALNLEPSQVLMVSGIGQAGKMPHYIHSHVLNELHGRAIPAAQAAKIVNHELHVIAVGGDGDGYGEGGNHFLGAMHRNIDMTYIVCNNQVYGLTKGQASPTSDAGFVTRTTPDGAWTPMRALAIAVASDCSFIARGFAGDQLQLTELIKQGILHQGFALIEVLQPCVSFNKINTFAWYKQRVYSLESDKGYDPSNRAAAFEKTLEWGERIPTGIFYKSKRPTYESQLAAIKNMPLIRQKILNPTDFQPLVEEFL
jgi:2-oxoglutarate/2-oxoacid ferredoxin oxidoreductase subunit beta